MKEKSVKSTMSFRISDDGRDLLERLSVEMGITYSAVLELAIRQMADQKGYRPKKSQEGMAADE